MWALTALLWHTDGIVDTGDPDGRPARFAAWRACVLDAMATGRSEDPVCAALLHTVRAWGMARDDVEAHLDGIMADLTVTEYPTYAQWERHNQAANGPMVRMWMRIFEPVTADALDRAMAFATAIQLLDYVCDVPEDAGLGRTYLPLEDLRAFGVTPADLASAESSPTLRDLMRHQVDQVRRVWAYGKGVVDAVDPRCGPWLRRGIREFDRSLTEIDRRGYDIALGSPRFGMRSWRVLAHVH